MIVKSAKRVRDVQSVVDRMEVTVKELIRVEQPMKEILPSVHHKSFRVLQSVMLGIDLGQLTVRQRTARQGVSTNKLLTVFSGRSKS